MLEYKEEKCTEQATGRFQLAWTSFVAPYQKKRGSRVTRSLYYPSFFSAD